MAIDLDQDIYGSSRDDVLSGGTGNDRMFGGAGSDVLNGGAGSDSLNGGSGDDTLVYNLSANSAAGTNDVYMGGSGKDTVLLQFTRAEWLTHQVQSQLAAYLAHLAAVTNTTTGEVSNGTASDFVFTFGSSSLTLQMVEKVRVSVGGVELSPENDAVTALADTGSAVEDGPAINISVLANDSVPDVAATLALATGPAHGTATLVQPDANVPSTWYFQYQANAADFQYLAKDQTATDSFTYTVTDADGSTGTATVTVTIKGTNDAPVVAGTDVTGAVTEMGTPSGSLTDSGTIGFTDVDLTDVHSVGAVTASAGALGTLTAGVSTDTTGTGTGGVVTWNYSVAAAAAEYLAAGQTKVETFSFDISDGQGGSVTRTVSVTLTGTNDGPIVAAGDVIGGVTEMGTPSGNLTDSGTIGFTDVDLTDVHSVGAVTASAGALGTLTAGVSTDTTGSGTGGVVTWNYSVAATAAEYLAAGQTKVETFSFDVSDGHGGSETRTVSVILTGTNDGPVVASEDVTGAVTEMGAPSGNLTDSGTIAFSDVDLTDVHSVGPVTASAGVLGTLTAGVSTDSTGSGSGGVVTWNYSVAAAAAEYLAAGQTKVETFSFDVSDGHGGSIARTVSVTLTGTNDGPVVASEDVTGAVTEMGTPAGTLTDSGTIAFTDADLADVHSVGPVTASAGALGTLTAGVSTDTTGSGSGGVVTWNYSVAAAAAEYLAAGQTKVETFSFDISDGQGGWVARTVSVTLTGTNDAPIVTAEDVTGAVTEMGTPSGNLTDSGTIGFTDVDLTDVHSVGAVTASAGALGTLTAGVSTDTAGSGTGGVVTWNYSVAATAAEYLAAGQTKVETFSFDVSDGHGGSETRTVSVTLTGTNDAPVVASEDVTGAVTEMGTPVGTLTDSGTIAFTDADLADVHSVGAVTASAGALGTLTASVSTDTTGSGTGGVVTWNYSVDAAAAEYLAAGQTKTENFSFVVSDGHGGSVTRNVSVTLAGTNDAPVVASDDVNGAVTEMGTPAGNLTDSGTIAFTDADLADVHSVGAVTASVGALGTFTAGVSTDTTGSGTGGVVTWNYSVAAAATEYLAAGQQKIETFSFDMSDGQGGNVTRTVSVTLTGTNDAPTTTPVTLAPVAENSGVRVITQAELLANAGDVDSTRLTADGLTLASGSKGQLTNNGDGTWNYTPAANDDTAALFSYTVSDGSLAATGSASLDITPVNGVQLQVNFDDIVTGAYAFGSIPYHYKGFDWPGFSGVFYGDQYQLNPSGYQAGVVSGTNDAWGYYSMSITRPTDFDFDSGYFTAAWNNAQLLQIAGYNNGILMGTQSVYLSSEHPTFVKFEDAVFDSVDKVVFTTTGGVDNPNYQGGGTFLVMDNLFFYV